MAVQGGRYATGAKGPDGGSPIPGDPTYIHRKAYDKISSGIGDSLPQGSAGTGTGSVGSSTPGQPGEKPPPTLGPDDKIGIKLGRGNRRKSGNPFSKLQTNSYEFQVDVNENIIGATFAKGSNQGNFNNEVDAVRDALAQIQELSPQTISSYQKKAGKEYRQAKGERPMHPEYAMGLNAAGKMSDKDMDDNDKAYDKMKKRGKGLAMSKGKGVQKEENLNELAPLITSVLAAKAARKGAQAYGQGAMKAGRGAAKVVQKIRNKTSFGPDKMGSKPKSMPKPPAVGASQPGGGPAKKPAPKYNEGNLGPRKAKAPKQMGPKNQMQSYDYGIEELSLIHI